ncbi:mannose-1-phosphate guanylyltransferase/mannose-6-phosphate isomerase [Noviherbaspirillum sp. Root189]|uniref:mannose-1-phosphate guanylyltransferase/mannose-6-phosphate isomerase n=1 Tax=Noviherbaspirillum sp. Root189 TaxID=1736487 RepID=UPI00070C3033|nr:mannose-1-phosphate guanylyltransferase/mannose-6-phosphate isomerase [Noviherbaspirillum sp. Root189]KRB90533.1 mannose-1-phosphate guanylyltransferase [Noviherbaspirillum sp. Root189]
MLIPIILSGGAGTRLWPVSREAHPKPFMRIGGGKSLLTQTHERALEVSGNTPPLIVTNRDYYFLSKDELADQQVKPQYMLEPSGRNTAPAIALAALWAVQQKPDACMLVMPADHLIKDTPSFYTSVRHAENLAKDGFLVLFGVKPTGPETGFGYIEMGNKVSEHAQVVQRFVEKPDAVNAARMLAEGNFVWNSGMFCFKASTILEAFATYNPALLESAREVWNSTKPDGDKMELPAGFTALENISIDYAVMEKAKNLAVIPGDFDWSDIGAWKAVAEAIPADAQGNTNNDCQTIVIDSRNTHIQTTDRLVAVIGLDNLLVIDTPDALLVADKSRSQEVKEVVNRLKASGHEAHKNHRTVARPWGTYTVLQDAPGFKIKRIAVKPGASLSLQMHHHRSEHWVVVSGKAEVINGEQTVTLEANQSTYIPAGNKHRLTNVGDTELALIEVQCGSYLGEDDIVRFEDIYGRVQ